MKKLAENQSFKGFRWMLLRKNLSQSDGKILVGPYFKANLWFSSTQELLKVQEIEFRQQ